MLAGQKCTLQLRATDPVTEKIITDAAATVYLFAPPKNPLANPGDRGSPDHTVTLTYDSVSRYYLAPLDTTGFTPGIWWLQGAILGGAASYNSWAYEPLEIDA